MKSEVARLFVYHLSYNYLNVNLLCCLPHFELRCPPLH